MNPLVASVIRTLVPNIVTQISAWLLLANVPLLPTTVPMVSSVVGFILFAFYYVGVRVIEQQWPAFGLLLGLTASPDTYSKGDPMGIEAPKQTSLAATAIDPAPAAPAVSFAPVQEKIDALPDQPVEVAPIFAPPAV